MEAVRALLDLLLPPHCAGCDLEGHVLCATCSAALYRRSSEPAGVPVGLPVSLPAGLVQLEWCAMYSGVARAAIHALKYRGERRLAEPLAAALADRWTRAGAGGDLLTWVPVHASRKRERGFDQAEVLARLVAGRLGIPCRSTLDRRRRTAAQHALDRRERAGNIEGGFHVPSEALRAVSQRWPIIVDDTVTTGATLSACAEALLGAGALAVSAVTLARDR